MMKPLSFLALFASLWVGATLVVRSQDPQPDPTLPQLGEQLFFDMNLSRDRNQACASCHHPIAGFADPQMVVSIGDDGHSTGTRNTPTASYAALTPEFHQRADGEYVGGQFWDGRAATLADQAGGPPLNPVEMNMPDRASVVARLRENPGYVEAFERHFGAGIWNDANAAYEAMTHAIAEFERSEDFAPFDSKYDRFLRGEAELTDEEELGRLLFFSEQFTNCNRCHQVSTSPINPRETFTNYEYHNIGVPRAHGLPSDPGLLAHPDVTDPDQAGKFRVPTLRNVAVTGPYMHNGAFDDLRTVVLFYNRYNTRDTSRWVNPETGQPFGPPDIPQTLAVEDLTHGPALDDRRVDALVAFMKTLTDQRYEHLLE